MKLHCYKITHSTTYHYSSIVSEGVHLVKLKPSTFPNQSCLHFSLQVSPNEAQHYDFTDYFGNASTHLTVPRPHQKLEVVSQCRVAVGLPFFPSPEETPRWETVSQQTKTDRGEQSLRALEYTFDSPKIQSNDDIAAFALDSFVPDCPILEAGLNLTKRIYSEFEFDPSATDVATPVSTVLSQRKGVCQDFAHLAIACFRSVGLPARYVSGYLETDPPPGEQKLVGVDASHAWLAFFCPGMGWIELDPTNGCIPSLRHIKIGTGRDYSDVAPLVGVIKGPDKHNLQIAVDVVADGELEGYPRPTQ